MPISFLFSVRFPIKVYVDDVDRWQIMKLEVLAPETHIDFLFRRSPRIQRLVQAQLPEIPKTSLFTEIKHVLAPPNRRGTVARSFQPDRQRPPNKQLPYHSSYQRVSVLYSDVHE